MFPRFLHPIAPRLAAVAIGAFPLCAQASPSIPIRFRWPSHPAEVIEWLLFAFAALLLCWALAIIWNFQLRRAVTQRTHEYHESMRRLVEAQAAGRVGDWEIDTDTFSLQWSEEMYRIFELDPARGVPAFDEAMKFFTPKEVELIRNNLQRAIDTGEQTRTETNPTLPGGRTLHLSTTINPVRDASGKVTRLVGTAQDVTERKQFELNLIASEARYRVLVDHAPDAIVTMDMQKGCFVDANPQACVLYGLPREVLLTKGPAELSPPTQPDGRSSAEAARELIESAIRGQTPAFRWDHIRPDGTIVPCEIRLVRLPSETTTLVRGSLTDITDRLRAEEDLKKRSLELERSNRELERFAYVASHDLQEPLRMVTSFTQLLAQRYAGKLDTDAHEFIGFAVDGAQRMQMLIDDLLAYSRAGRHEYQLTQVKADHALDNALANLKPAIESAGAVITREPLPTVTADPIQLVQVFQNLVSNAVKFRTEKAPEVHISARRDNGDWVFAVRDNGIGIEPAHTGRLFVMFQRLHPRHQYPGTGIGLALCKMIVERLGGAIRVNSTPGHGSTFEFTVPDHAGTQP